MYNKSDDRKWNGDVFYRGGVLKNPQENLKRGRWCYFKLAGWMIGDTKKSHTSEKDLNDTNI